MIKCLLRNVRGISNASSLKRVRKLSKIHNISFLAVLEPMTDASKLEKIRSKLKFSSAYSNITSKVWVFWKPIMQCSVLSDTEQALTMRGTHDLVEGEFVISSVYAKCIKEDRRCLWDKLKIVHDLQRP
ncbi:hypothetical protein LguiB_032018 [Lonicera macranthoides]